MRRRLIPVLPALLLLSFAIPASPAAGPPTARPGGVSAAGARPGTAAVAGRPAVAGGQPGTALFRDPVTGRMTLVADDTVVHPVADGVDVRREPGRLRLLIAGGEGVYAGAARCTLGANVRQGTTAFFISSGHCAGTGTTWFASPGQGTLLGTRTGLSFPGNDYAIVRYTNPAVAHPSAVQTPGGLLPLTGWAGPVVGQAVCRSGATTGVRCGTVTALNATVTYAEGTVTGLIRTNICAEPGDSGGPLYTTAGVLIGILSGGSGTCTTGGTTYFQPVGEILSAYGVTVP
ncbi:streptogrisin B [Actinoplanes sp. N902-109]|nr:streptogrisin B [Actinoplanes sp. N902-109]